ncbi:MAG: peptide deformylase [Anaeroplasmataceae bacterium]|jgi:peptide deformylase|nr:peptide deformylase [Anaeroplasmataceae bacterium]
MYLNKDIVKEGNQILKNKSAMVSMPLSSADLNCLKGLYEYVVISSVDELVKQYDIRPGVGIAAPQVGVNKRMFAMNAVDFLDEKESRYLFAIINPIITYKSKELTYLPGGEGCLSVDRSTNGLVTPRHYAITAKCSIYDFNTNKIKTVTLKLEGYPAIVFQHEFDHLDGILFTDKMYHPNDLDKNIFPLYEETEE